MDNVINQYKQIVGDLLKQPTLRFNAELSQVLPRKPGVYRILEQSKPNQAIYIGKTKSLHRRIIGDHFQGDRIASTLKRKLISGMGLADEQAVKDYLASECLVQYYVIEDRALLTSIEHFAVAVLAPKWND